MSTETNQDEVIVDSETNEDTGEGDVETLKAQMAEIQAELSKKDETIGSLKRDLKVTKKEAKKEPEVESPKETEKPDEFGLLQKTYLRSAGITDTDEVELARSLQEKTGMELDELVDDDFFKAKLEALRNDKATVEATADVRGGSGKQEAKYTPEYWVAKGTPPSREDVPDRKTRAKIHKAMLADAKSGKMFYND